MSSLLRAVGEAEHLRSTLVVHLVLVVVVAELLKQRFI